MLLSCMTAIRCGWKKAKNMRNFLKFAKIKTRKSKNILKKSIKSMEHSMHQQAIQGSQVENGKGC